MERRLAAILAADVVGYSRLMGEDEAGTLSALNAHRKELIEPKVRQYNGRIVKLMGDGALMEFPSAVDAVAFAVEAQCAMAERNEGIPATRQIVYRIGINVGDIIIEDDDIFGDGVNIAARLEALAEPGGICVARNVLNQVKGKLDLTFKLLGKRKVKNIAQPVTAHRVLLDDKADKLRTEVQTAASARSGWQAYAAAALVLLLVAAGGIIWWQPWQPSEEPTRVETTAEAQLPDKPSIAVLPFANLSNDKEHEYFSDGISEDLITDLSKISGLIVVARNSTFSYKGQAVDIRKIAVDLGVQYVVEGSVRRVGGRVRITAQLIDAKTGYHVWAERYDRELKDIFELQDDVREKIVSALAVKLTPSQTELLSHWNRIGVEAYDLFLRGIEQEGFFTKQANLRSREYFKSVKEMEPGFAEAQSRLASAYDIAAIMGWSDDPKEDLHRAALIAQKAVSLDDSVPYAHWALARIYTHLYRHKEAIASLEKAISLAPNYADAYAYLALVYNYAGEAAKGLDATDKALKLNPKAPYWYYYARGLSLYLLEQYEKAITVLLRSVEANQNVIWARQYLIAAYGHIGDVEEAQWQIDELSAQGYEVTISSLGKLSSIRDERYLARYLEDLRAAGVPN